MKWAQLTTAERLWSVVALLVVLLNLISVAYGGTAWFLVGAAIMSWIVGILARRKNRSPIAWGAAGFVLGLGALIVLAICTTLPRPPEPDAQDYESEAAYRAALSAWQFRYVR